MDFSKLPLFAMMQRKMEYHSERQEHIARNIANANTPNYAPKDLAPLDFGEVLQEHSGNKLTMAKTASGHLRPGQDTTGRSKVVTGSSFDVTPTGNGVVIEEQMIKMQGNTLDYQATTSLYRRMNDLFNTALGQQ
jgi:flagellar basal-body rod protein FlgB